MTTFEAIVQAQLAQIHRTADVQDAIERLARALENSQAIATRIIAEIDGERDNGKD